MLGAPRWAYFRWFAPLCLIGVLLLACRAGGGIDLNRANQMPLYQSRYYLIHTDLNPLLAREAMLRMTRMAEEYHNRTKDYSGVITQKLPFYLFRSMEDYQAVGGLPNTAGVFTGSELLAFAGDEPDAMTWHTVQHEGFHQFAKAVIGGEMPIWMNEGIAEYFGEALFTGDSFQSGIIPEERRQRVKAQMQADYKSGGFRAVIDLMQVSHLQWNQEMNGRNYDQAWSMVQFLAHGDQGKYDRPFNLFMKELNRGVAWEQAWRDNFGNTVGFEDRWRNYWLNLPPNPTDDLYASANVATLTSFLARAYQQKQMFVDFKSFSQAAGAGKLKIIDNDWLPASLLEIALKNADEHQARGAVYEISNATPQARSQRKLPQIVCNLPDGVKLTGVYTFTNGMVATVSVEQAVPKASARGAAQ